MRGGTEIIRERKGTKRTESEETKNEWKMNQIAQKARKHIDKNNSINKLAKKSSRK